MEKEFYTCEYCFKEFEPKRRRIQKFCSNSCRSKAHHANKHIEKLSANKKEQNDKPTVNKVEKMSVAGVGNSAAGTLLADGIKSFVTKEQNKPATKADMAYIASKIKRYHKIVNLPPNNQGALPYFDLETNEIKYSFIPPYGKP